MDLSNLFPPSDLLEKTRGVESGLRQRRHLGAFGWFGFILFSAIDISLEISNLGFVSRVLESNEVWRLVPLVVLAVFFLLLGTWSRFWLKESRQPFRYTCSISSFVPISGKKANPLDMMDECMTWLPHDIIRLLNERVQRFLFASEAHSAGKKYPGFV